MLNDCQSYSPGLRSRASTVYERINPNGLHKEKNKKHVPPKTPPFPLWKERRKCCALLTRLSHSKFREITCSQSHNTSLALDTTTMEKTLWRQTITNPPVPFTRLWPSAPSTPYPLLQIHNRSIKDRRSLRDLVRACGGLERLLCSALLSSSFPYPT